MVGFEQDISNMMYSFSAGVVSESDFENLMAAEKKRTSYSITLSEAVRNEMENIFTLYDKMIGSMDKRVVIPAEIIQAVFQYISKGMLIVKNFQRVVKSSSLTIGSTIATADAELAAGLEAEKPIDVVTMIATLDELQRKAVAIDDDDDSSSSLFYRKKKDAETQTPFPPPAAVQFHSQQGHHRESHYHGHHHDNHPGSEAGHHQTHGSHQMQGNHPGGIELGIGLEGHHMGPSAHGGLHPQGQYHGLQGHHPEGHPSGTELAELTMNQREMRFGIPGVQPSAAASTAKSSRHTMAEIDMHDVKKPQRGLFSKKNDGNDGNLDQTNQAKGGLLGQLDAHAIAEIEDKLSRAREIQTKGIQLELRVEEMEKEEIRMSQLNKELQDRMQAMEDKYANIDDLIEERYRRYLLEQQMLIKMNKAKAGGNKWLENLSEMDRRAQERKMLLKLREAEHEQKRLEKKAAEEVAEAELMEKKRLEMLEAGKDSDDEGSSTKTRRHRAKVEKLKVKGDHLDNKPKTEDDERLKRLQRGKDVRDYHNVPANTMEFTDESIEILSYFMRKSSPGPKVPIKYIDIKAIGNLIKFVYIYYYV